MQGDAAPKAGVFNAAFHAHTRERGDTVSLIKWSEEGDAILIGLPGDLDLGMAGPLAEALRCAAGQDKPVRVIADKVERLGAAPVQALYAASRGAALSGRKFTLVGPSETFVETCDDLGLANWLKQWSEQ